ncbi:MAG: DUF1045 domain-containing protein [Deltaproteobacteria bacterium]|jgi:hypothetical protein|nr:DUF1045 domain-containing protein [Deltaproteobacteria bacterium]
MSERYSIYHVPDPLSEACRLGSAALGRSIRSGKALPPPWPASRGGDFPPHPAAAAVYGFHATLVAPFRSPAAAGTLADALDSAAAGLDAASTGPLELVLLPPGFPALVPRELPGTLADLGETLVRAFSGLRHPPVPEEISRREPLTPRQRELAGIWGYPFVLDEFRYHLTLGDRLRDPGEPPDPRTLNLMDFVSARLGGAEARGLAVDALCLCRQSRAGTPFDIVHVSRLRPAGNPGGSPGPPPPPEDPEVPAPLQPARASSPAVRAGAAAGLPGPGSAGFPGSGTAGFHGPGSAGFPCSGTVGFHGPGAAGLPGPGGGASR